MIFFEGAYLVLAAGVSSLTHTLPFFVSLLALLVRKSGPFKIIAAEMNEALAVTFDIDASEGLVNDGDEWP